MGDKRSLWIRKWSEHEEICTLATVYTQQYRTFNEGFWHNFLFAKILLTVFVCFPSIYYFNFISYFISVYHIFTSSIVFFRSFCSSLLVFFIFVLFLFLFSLTSDRMLFGAGDDTFVVGVCRNNNYFIHILDVQHLNVL